MALGAASERRGLLRGRGRMLGRLEQFVELPGAGTRAHRRRRRHRLHQHVHVEIAVAGEQPQHVQVEVVVAREQREL